MNFHIDIKCEPPELTLNTEEQLGFTPQNLRTHTTDGTSLINQMKVFVKEAQIFLQESEYEIMSIQDNLEKMRKRHAENLIRTFEVLQMLMSFSTSYEYGNNDETVNNAKDDITSDGLPDNTNGGSENQFKVEDIEIEVHSLSDKIANDSKIDDCDYENHFEDILINFNDEPFVDGIHDNSKFPDHRLMDKDYQKSISSEVKESDYGDEQLPKNNSPTNEDHSINHSISNKSHDLVLNSGDCNLSKKVTNVLSDKNTEVCKKENSFSKEESGIRFDERKIKVQRPCLFCRRFFVGISRHLKTEHREEKEMKDALSLPKEEQTKALALLRKKGIHEYNLQVLQRRRKPSLVRERQKDYKKWDTVLCKGCTRVFQKQYFLYHKKKCKITIKDEFESRVSSTALLSIDDNFKKDILDKFRRVGDPITNLCLENNMIINVGKDLYRSVVSHPEKSRSALQKVMYKMRLLSRLLLQFVEYCNEDQSLNNELRYSHDTKVTYEDIFDIQYFPYFEKSFFSLTNNERKTMHSVKLHLHSALNSLCGVMSQFYMIEGNNDMLKKLKEFQAIWAGRIKSLFREVNYNVKTVRDDLLRGPFQLSLKEDIKILNNFITEGIENIMTIKKEAWNKNIYLKARRLCITSLSFLNAQRSAEPSFLTLSDIETAVKNQWADHERMADANDPAEVSLVNNNKIAYQEGKENKDKIHIIIPDFMIPLIIALCEGNVRSKAGVSPLNFYAFPSTGQSQCPCSAWHEVHTTCAEANIKCKLNIDKMRYQAGVLFRSLHVPAEDKHLFYSQVIHVDDKTCSFRVPDVSIKVEKNLDTNFPDDIALIDRVTASSTTSEENKVSVSHAESEVEHIRGSCNKRGILGEKLEVFSTCRKKKKLHSNHIKDSQTLTASSLVKVYSQPRKSSKIYGTRRFCVLKGYKKRGKYQRLDKNLKKKHKLSADSSACQTLCHTQQNQKKLEKAYPVSPSNISQSKTGDGSQIPYVDSSKEIILSSQGIFESVAKKPYPVSFEEKSIKVSQGISKGESSKICHAKTERPNVEAGPSIVGSVTFSPTEFKVQAIKPRVSEQFSIRRRKTFNLEERELIIETFQEYIDQNCLPSIPTIRQYMKQSPLDSIVEENHYQPSQIKGCLLNVINKRKRRLSFQGTN